MVSLPDFKPFPFFRGSHRQTVIGSLFAFYRAPISQTRLVKLPDQDLLALEVTIPKYWQVTDPTIVMVHGLCGSHKSPYLVRLAKRFYRLGYRAIRLNLRGCGSGRGLARGIYHSGCSDDIGAAVVDLKQEHPDSPIILIGFSLGGNIILKLAGELAKAANAFIQGLIAVSPPVDLFSSVKMLRHPSNRIYERHFLRLLLEYVAFRHKCFPDLPQVVFPEDLNFFDLDELYVAPQCGFRNAMEYYTLCSSRPLIPKISVPCKILFAKDDPIIDPTSLDHVRLPKHVEVHKTESGGHLGFLGMPGFGGGFRWMDNVLLKWVKDLLNLSSE